MVLSRLWLVSAVAGSASAAVADGDRQARPGRRQGGDRCASSGTGVAVSAVRSVVCQRDGTAVLPPASRERRKRARSTRDPNDPPVVPPLDDSESAAERIDEIRALPQDLDDTPHTEVTRLYYQHGFNEARPRSPRPPAHHRHGDRATRLNWLSQMAAGADDCQIAHLQREGSPNQSYGAPAPAPRPARSVGVPPV